MVDNSVKVLLDCLNTMEMDIVQDTQEKKNHRPFSILSNTDKSMKTL